MYIELVRREEEKGFIHLLQFRVVAERIFDSPLHVLPDLIRLLVKKSLNTYAVHFILNAYGRFDLEIKSEYPHVHNKHLSLDLRKKVGRLQRLFYETPREYIEQIDYDEFLDQLMHYTPRYLSLDDATLFSYPVQWHGLLETYQFLHTEALDDSDAYHCMLEKTDEKWISPAMSHKPCPFDKADFLEEQVVLGFEHFFLCLNYRPIGDSSFHMMIVPYAHQGDLVHLSAMHLFEMEALLRATLGIWQGAREDLVIYMQKHAQSGMTVPHMHIHVLFPSTQQAFREDIIQQLRFFASILGGDEEKAHALARRPLSAALMKRHIWRFKQPMKQSFAREIKIQGTRYAQLRFSQVALLRTSKK